MEKIKLQKQFEEFHGEIALTDHRELKEKRSILEKELKDKFPEKMNKEKKLKEENSNDLKISDLKFIDQGSWAQGVKTSIDPMNKTFDRDVAMIFPLDILIHKDPREIKKIVKDILTIQGKREPKIKEPCVTVTYSKEGDEIYHLDFPIYAKAKYGNLYLARGKECSESYEWEESDPEGLNEYFKEQFEGEIGNQKRRIVRYLKQWKQIKYNGSQNGNEIPPSIGLTILVCKNFQYNEKNDLKTLYYTLKRIYDKFIVIKNSEKEITEVIIYCDLPTKPFSDVFYKMRKSKEHLITFYKRFQNFYENIRNAYEAEHDHEAANYIVKSLGSEFEVPDKEAAVDTSKLKKEDRFAKLY